jgi:hemerythrin superfamily protein
VPRSGAKYGPLFEQMEAAHWRGLSDQQFSDLSLFEQARIVAHYRAHHQLEAVIADAQMKKQQQDAKRQQHGQHTRQNAAR